MYIYNMSRHALSYPEILQLWVVLGWLPVVFSIILQSLFSLSARRIGGGGSGFMVQGFRVERLQVTRAYGCG